MNQNSRIAVNIIILYTKLIVTIAVNLYSIRLILNTMGVEDYGIVNLVSGIVAMLSFLQNSMTISTQRYLSVNMGKHDLERQKQIFNSSLFLHIGLAVFLLIVLEVAQPLIFNTSIQIPETRQSASQVLYQLTIVGTLFVIIGVPFDATLNAHENMLWFSFASIVESVIRLSGAILLLDYQHDKLIFYGFLIVVIQMVSFTIKAFYCIRHYKETKIALKNSHRILVKEMTAFASWNIAGAFALAGRSQGIAVVLNIFHGVAINAAYGIALHVSGQLSNFTATLTKAMAPQIMQNRGSGNFYRMFSLAIAQCKYSYIMLLLIAIPIFIDMPFILNLWLKEVPTNTITFCRLIILTSLAQQLTGGIQTLIQANGKISKYQLTVAAVLLLNIPVAYILLYLGFHPTVVMISMLILEVLCMAVRFFFAHELVGMSYFVMWKDLILPISAITLTASVICAVSLVTGTMFSSTFSFIIHCLCTATGIGTVSYFTMSIHERQTIITQIGKVKTKVFK